ncbi:MAG: delta 1-pyrroline-5-carboxylate synthetase [Candidatus Bathyarchaeia archaeon]|jgi:hypothetical protein
MDAVLKVGGSLAEKPESLKALCQQLMVLAKKYRIVVVPGGGTFADAIREMDKTFGLSDTVAHELAVRAMDQYGLLLADITPNSWIFDDITEAKNAPNNMLPIFLPSKHVITQDPLPNSWDVTSDSIAAYVAGLLHSKMLVLVTNVDGVYCEDPKQNKDTTLIDQITAKELQSWKRRTSVDKMLPTVLLQNRLDCFVVNGNYPERIRAVLENRKTVCTQITVC